MMKSDIRMVKQQLRDRNKEYRIRLSSAGIDQKKRMDDQIFKRLLQYPMYTLSRVVLTYVSTKIEVDTHRLIQHSLQNGKLVAVPKCIPSTREMKFCIISSLKNDLCPGSFSVLEPKPHCQQLQHYDNSFCIVPGLMFDMQGYRLGYGKGYYDRFLNHYPGYIAGISYSTCLKTLLPHGRYDHKLDCLITDKFIKTFKRDVKI